MAKLWAKIELKIPIIPYLGIRFWPLFSHFLSNRAKKNLVTQEIIIYRLVMRNRDFDAFWKKNPIFGGKMVVAKGSGALKPDQKVGPLGSPFGSTNISKISYENELRK